MNYVNKVVELGYFESDEKAIEWNKEAFEMRRKDIENGTDEGFILDRGNDIGYTPEKYLEELIEIGSRKKDQNTLKMYDKVMKICGYDRNTAILMCMLTTVESDLKAVK